MTLLGAGVDEQGRIILPPEAAKALGFAPGEEVQLAFSNQGLILQPSANRLQRVYVEITNRCNLTCSTCMRNVWDVAYGSMTEDTFERALTGMAAFDPLPELFIGGYGEPLSHPNCLALIARAKAQGLRVSLITNGILLHDQMAQALIDLRLDALWVSLDGASPESYADVRLGNALPEIQENLRQMRDMQYRQFGSSPWAMRPRLGVAFVAMQRNIHDLPAVIRMGVELGALEFSISNVLVHDQSLLSESLYLHALDKMGGRSKNRWKPLVRLPKMDATPETTGALAELLKGNYCLEFMGSELGADEGRCPFIERGSLSIRWDGQVSPCLPMLYTHQHYLAERQRTSHAYSVGDVHTAELRAIWQDPAYTALRTRLRDFDFSPCALCNSCENADQNLEDCFGNTQPACGGCLWAQGLIRCP